MAAKNAPKEALPQPEIEAPPPKKKSRAKKIVIIAAILLIVLGGAGGGAYWWFFLHKPAAAVESTEAEQTAATAEADKGKPSGAADAQGKGAAGTAAHGAGSAGSGGSGGSARIEAPSGLPRSAGQVFPLPSIKVNLTDAGGRRYLTLGMEVEANADVSAQIKAQSPRIRDAIIMLLAGKAFSDISTPDGKILLKAEVAAKLNQVFGAQRVIQVYFTNFVVE